MDMRTYNHSLLLLLFFSPGLTGMDHPVSPYSLGSIPDEIVYKIIEQWPALNVYRLIDKQFHRLTSYEHADEIIQKINLSAIGSWDLQKLLLKYILKNDTQKISTVLADTNRTVTLHCNPITSSLSENTRTVLEKHKFTFPNTESCRLYNAACCGNSASVPLEFCAKPASLKSQSDFGYTPLEGAVAYDRPEIITFLCQLGAPRSNTQPYRSILHIAAECSDINTVKHIVTNNITIINDQNDQHLTAFMLALARGRLEIAKLLYQMGASIHINNQQYGLPLFNACIKGRAEIVEFLLKYGFDPDPVFVSKENQRLTPLFAAVTCNHIEIAQKLIRAGANVNHGAQSGDSDIPIATPLIQAAYCGNLDMIQLLVKSGASISNPQFKGKNALQTARDHCHEHVARWLEDYGFNA